jgi:hypothetical protein
VLVIAGGVQGSPDDRMSEFVEDEQVGLELADFVFDFLFVEMALPALTFAEGAVGPSGSRSLVAFFAGPDGFADDPALDPAGALVTARVFGEGIPGHGGFGSGACEKGTRRNGAAETCGRGRTPE